MKASELITRLNAMVHHNGDLEVVVLDGSGEVNTLLTQVEVDRFASDAPDVFVLEHKEYRW
jgi:hypothetical protein